VFERWAKVEPNLSQSYLARNRINIKTWC